MRGKNTTGIMLANVTVIGLAIVSFMTVGNIQQLYPFDNMIIDDRTPSFEWSGWNQDYELLIDDDADFTTPYSYSVTGRTFTVDDELGFGTYWWKVRSGEMESGPKKFTVVSTVALSRPEGNTIVNSGNTDLLVYRSGLAGAVTLVVNETLEVEEEDNVKAEQK